MRKVLIAAGAAASLLMLGATAAQASTAAPRSLSPTITSNNQGAAGYYVNESDGYRIRDVRAQFALTAQSTDLNGTNEGAEGVELCNPNTNFGAQLGVFYNGTSFSVGYLEGQVDPNSNAEDPCVQTGVVNGSWKKSGSLLSNITVNPGDTLEFEIYYNPSTHWTSFTATDVTQNVQRTASLNLGYQSFYEAGIGIASNNGTNLVAPAVNTVASFTNARFTNYNRKGSSTSILGPWQTVQSQFVNKVGETTVSPNSSLNAKGNAFTDFQGQLNS